MGKRVPFFSLWNQFDLKKPAKNTEIAFLIYLSRCEDSHVSWDSEKPRMRETNPKTCLWIRLAVECLYMTHSLYAGKNRYIFVESYIAFIGCFHILIFIFWFWMKTKAAYYGKNIIVRIDAENALQSEVSWAHCHFSTKCSQKTIHGSPVREGYECRFSINVSYYYYMYMYFHYYGKTVSRPSDLYNGNLYTDVTPSLYWIGPSSGVLRGKIKSVIYLCVCQVWFNALAQLSVGRETRSYFAYT